MNDQRWRDLMHNDKLDLTDDEISAGWHFCLDWDGLLIGPGMEEMMCCTCLDQEE